MTDTERLDFLIEKEAHVWENWNGKWCVTRGHSDDPEYLGAWNGNYRTAREAIDGAIAEVNGTEDAPRDAG